MPAAVWPRRSLGGDGTPGRLGKEDLLTSVGVGLLCEPPGIERKRRPAILIEEICPRAAVVRLVANVHGLGNFLAGNHHGVALDLRVGPVPGVVLACNLKALQLVAVPEDQAFAHVLEPK